MSKENYTKGIIFALGALFLVSLQPIVANSRPEELDAYLFAAMTCVIMSFIFFPLTFIERKNIKTLIRTKPNDSQNLQSLLNGWKKHKIFMIYLGINFGIAQVLFFLAYQYAGAINGSIAQTTAIIFALLLGYLINNEKISKIQVIFSFLVFFGLFLAITQGSFNLLNLNVGVLLMLITVTLWMFAHSLTKPIFEKSEATPIEIGFIRNIISGFILFVSYFILFPDNFYLLLKPINIFFFILMGLLYGFDILCWYKSISYIDVSKASTVVSPLPILTALFATLILGEIFTIYHLIGTIIIVFSIVIIVREKPPLKMEI